VIDHLGELFRHPDLQGNWLGAVTNVLQHNDANRPQELGLPSADVYFNAGVLLMNLAQMRDDAVSRELIAYARANTDVIAFRDQDVLNVVLGERRLELHPRWNCMNAFYVLDNAPEVLGADRLQEAMADPAIRHFEGPAINKPWHYLCEREMRELYAEHRAHTPWPRMRVEGRTPANMLRRMFSA
jgi:lipopolysaccharide biosynthesis glycosyltransferase